MRYSLTGWSSYLDCRGYATRCLEATAHRIIIHQDGKRNKHYWKESSTIFFKIQKILIHCCLGRDCWTFIFFIDAMCEQWGVQKMTRSRSRANHSVGSWSVVSYLQISVSPCVFSVVTKSLLIRWHVILSWPESFPRPHQTECTLSHSSHKSILHRFLPINYTRGRLVIWRRQFEVIIKMMSVR